MAKTTKRKQIKRRTLKQGILAPLAEVERDMRRAVKREKNVQKIQRQLRRELAKSRAALADLVNFMEAKGYIVNDAPAVQEPLIK